MKKHKKMQSSTPKSVNMTKQKVKNLNHIFADSSQRAAVVKKSAGTGPMGLEGKNNPMMPKKKKFMKPMGRKRDNSMMTPGTEY